MGSLASSGLGDDAGFRLTQLSQGIRQSHERLLRFVGSLKELVLPTEEELDVVAQAAFESTGLDMFDVPFEVDPVV